MPKDDGMVLSTVRETNAEQWGAQVESYQACDEHDHKQNHSVLCFQKDHVPKYC